MKCENIGKYFNKADMDQKPYRNNLKICLTFSFLFKNSLEGQSFSFGNIQYKSNSTYTLAYKARMNTTAKCKM